MTQTVKQPPDAIVSSRKPNLKKTVDAVFLVRHALSNERSTADLAAICNQLPAKRVYMNARAAADAFSARPADIDRVADYLRGLGLKVVEADPAASHVVIRATLAAYEKAFGIAFVIYNHPKGAYLSYTGKVRVPAAVNRMVTEVLGLDQRSMARPHLHHPALAEMPQPATKVGRIYRFPKSDAQGECIAIVSLGGGIYRSDIREYFQRRGLPQPKVDIILADGAKNRPAKRSDLRKYLGAFRDSVESGMPPTLSFPADLEEQIEWTIETTMDVQLVGTLAPGARIALYLGKNDEAGKVHALANAITDRKRNPSVITCSWGEGEDEATQQGLNAMTDMFVQAGLRGITVCVSTGDGGSPPDTPINVPASNPWVLACGGTSLSVGGSREKVWNEPIGTFVLASTGGFSTVFPLPSWQMAATSMDRPNSGNPGRGVPDVAAKADLRTGYMVRIGSVDAAMGGTSAAAPTWASLAAVINKKLKLRVGFFAALLYTGPFRGATRQIVEGGTQSFKAHTGWNACTGWGSPVGVALLKALEP